MATPVTLKLRPKNWLKLSAIKNFWTPGKDLTWDDFFEDFINSVLPLVLLRFYTQMTGKLPESRNEFEKGISYMSGFLEGTGMSLETVSESFNKMIETLKNWEPKNSRES